MPVAPAITLTEIETSAAIAGTFTPSFESGVATAGCGGDGGKPGPVPQPDLSVPASPLPEGNRGQNSRAPAIMRTIWLTKVYHVHRSPRLKLGMRKSRPMQRAAL
jgi:hypothetical protein